MGRPAQGGPVNHCSFERHERCNHYYAIGYGLLGRGERRSLLLCQCPCHEACPLRGRQQVNYAVWDRDCVCPGAPDSRKQNAELERKSAARWAEHERQAAERRQQAAEILQDLDIGRGKSADQIQREILTAYRAHGVEPDSDFSRVARFLAAGSARRGTRIPRLLWEFGKGIRAVGRWADEHAISAEPVDVECSVENRRELRRLNASVAGCAALAIAAAVAGLKATGYARVLLVLAAVLLTALSTWVGLIAFGASLLDRLSGSHRRQTRPRP